jgi:hypothetical protein
MAQSQNLFTTFIGQMKTGKTKAHQCCLSTSLLPVLWSVSIDSFDLGVDIVNGPVSKRFPNQNTVWICCLKNVTVEWLAFMLRIQNVLGSNLGPEASYSD